MSVRKPPRRHLLVVYGALVVFGISLLALGQRAAFRRVPVSRAEQPPKAAVLKRDSQPTSMTSQKAADGGITLVDDDGKTLWMSPTAGKPIDTAYLPPGVQVIIAARPESIAGHAEGDKVIDGLLQAAGPALKRLSDEMPSVMGVTHMVVGLGLSSGGKWSATEVVHLSGNETAAEYIAREFPDAEAQKEGDHEYWIVGERAYYTPEANGKLLVITSPDNIADIIRLAGEAPPLRRDLERLLARTDAERDVTIVVAPNSLFGEGRSIFVDELAGLREPLFWFLGDKLSAVALSVDWGEDFYFELAATPTLDTSPERASRILRERAAELPAKLESFVVELNPQPYGKVVIARVPAMIRTLDEYTRSGFDRDVTMLNGCLPVTAGHNLLVGAELLLAESGRGSNRTAAEAASPSERLIEHESSIDEKLRRVTSLRFARDTLEAALDQLSRDIGVPIVVRGADLQAEGITKNQSFGIDLTNKPAKEVLVEILRLANPDKTATSPGDVKQKLVYVVGAAHGGGSEIVVTTRSAANARGEKLPAAFQASP